MWQEINAHLFFASFFCIFRKIFSDDMSPCLCIMYQVTDRVAMNDLSCHTKLHTLAVPCTYELCITHQFVSKDRPANDYKQISANTFTVILQLHPTKKPKTKFFFDHLAWIIYVLPSCNCLQLLDHTSQQIYLERIVLSETDIYTNSYANAANTHLHVTSLTNQQKLHYTMQLQWDAYSVMH